MNTTDFLCSYTDIKEKNDKYYLFLGITYGLNSKEILDILNSCLTRDIFKRKILLNKIVASAPSWSRNANDNLFKRIYFSLDSLNSYSRKESASMILIGLCPYISANNQKRLLHYLLRSNYKNNRKRAYTYLLKNWSPKYQGIIEKIWREYNDEEAMDLIVARMSREFLYKNFKDIMSHFEGKDLDYDLPLKVLRNKYYSRIADNIPSVLKELKNEDPISFIFIMKECGKKINPSWAMKIYKKLSQSRKYLPRWYAEMGLWNEIFKSRENLLK